MQCALLLFGVYRDLVCEGGNLVNSFQDSKYIMFDVSRVGAAGRALETDAMSKFSLGEIGRTNLTRHTYLLTLQENYMARYCPQPDMLSLLPCEMGICSENLNIVLLGALCRLTTKQPCDD